MNHPHLCILISACFVVNQGSCGLVIPNLPGRNYLCTISDSLSHGYMCLSQLQALDSCRPSQQLSLPNELYVITTPLRVSAWEEALGKHPDRQFVEYVVSGLKNGFRIGFDHITSKLTSSRNNMLSAKENPHVVDEYLLHEISMDRMWKMTEPPSVPFHCHVSPIGVIPKKNRPGKWRLIVYLSSPEGASVNDGISREMCSLSYVSIDSIVDCILKLGKGALMAKIDIKQAYRNIPMHPMDHYLLGVQWKGELYIDKVLPFGLRSAPIIFSAVADALQWIMQQRGVEFIFHYLDDYITVSPPASDLCATNLRVIKQACHDTGTPIEEAKYEGSSAVITFLGMELDTVALEICLPADKLKRLKDLPKEWRGRKAGKKRDLLSLIGTLHHASKAVRQGRTFLRRLINLSMAIKHVDNFVRLNISARSDIQWWWGFAESWNGVSMLFRQDMENPQVIVTSDASGSWGCGAYCSSSWFQFQWPPRPRDKPHNSKGAHPSDYGGSSLGS